MKTQLLYPKIPGPGIFPSSLAAPVCVAVAGAAYQDEPMEIMAGTAKASVNLNVSYKKRS